MDRKDLEYYTSLPYRLGIYPEEKDGGYTAIIPDLPGCMTCANTLDELWKMIEDAKSSWLEAALEEEDYIPEPAPVEAGDSAVLRDRAKSEDH